MHRIVFRFVFLIGFGLGPVTMFGQEPIAVGPDKGHVLADTVPAPSLAGNLLGDSTRQLAYIYLPPGYDESNQRYRVLYLLHGVLDDPGVWVEPAYQGMTIQATMDSLIVAGEIEPFIVAMPNGKNAYGGSFYMDSPVIGDWETYVVDDVVAYVDATYRTVPRREARAIAGHSMGGYGAIRLGMRHPDVYSAVFGMAPCCLCCWERDLTGDLDAWRILRQADSVDDLWAALRDRDDPWPLMVAAGAAAFSPRPGRPPWYFRLPYELRDGRAVPTAALRDWNAASVAARAADYARNLRRLEGLAFDSGYEDQYEHIPAGTTALSDTLVALRVPHVFEMYDGDHRNRMRERMAAVVLPWIDERLQSGARATMADHVLTVRGWPPIAIELDRDLVYVGERSLQLYDVASAEQHVFVEADRDSTVRRLYWFQIEEVLPASDHRYDYSDLPGRVERAGLTFLTDSRFGPAYSLENVDPLGDTAEMLRLLQVSGYHMPEEMMRLRMVALDAERRRELLVIYIESLAARGLSVEAFERDRSAWREAGADLRERALEGLEIVPRSSVPDERR